MPCSFSSPNETAYVKAFGFSVFKEKAIRPTHSGDDRAVSEPLVLKDGEIFKQLPAVVLFVRDKDHGHVIGGRAREAAGADDPRDPGDQREHGQNGHQPDPAAADRGEICAVHGKDVPVLVHISDVVLPVREKNISLFPDKFPPALPLRIVPDAAAHLPPADAGRGSTAAPNPGSFAFFTAFFMSF